MKKYFSGWDFCIFLLLILNIDCRQKKDSVKNHICRYNGETIRLLNEEPAQTKELEGELFLWFGNGIRAISDNLMDTLFLLKPCNLAQDFKIDRLFVIISGEIKDNPPLSSHTNYTDLYLTEIRKVHNG